MRNYKGYLLGLLTVIQGFNYVDRVALGIVLQDIKADFHLSDTQLGLLTGIAFAFLYAVMGIPIARRADRGNRVAIITITTAVWSVAVALCGVARNFGQLLLIRMAVAVGEAGCIPPAHSLMADYFKREERARALSLYMLGAPLALAIGYLGAGWLNQLLGWRKAFVLLGLPGLVLAALSVFTLREPRNAPATPSTPNSSRLKESQLPHPSAWEVCVVLWRNTTFRHLLICFSVLYFFSYGLLQWTPTLFVRSYGLATGELGMWFAVIHGLGGGLGTYLGGEWCARYASGNERLQLIVCALSCVLYVVLNTYAFLAPNYHAAFVTLLVAAIGCSMAWGPMLAIMQTLVQPRMRAMSIALVYLFANLIGMGLGPLAAGALSDALLPRLGQESLRWALVGLCPGYFWAAWHLWRASRAVGNDLHAAKAHDTAGIPANTALQQAL